MNVQQCQKCDLITSKHDIAPILNSHWIKNEVVLVKDELLVACAFWTVLRYLGMHVPRVTFRSNPVSQSHARIHICTRMYTLPLRRDWPFHGFMSLACVNQSCGIFFFFSHSLLAWTIVPQCEREEVLNEKDISHCCWSISEVFLDHAFHASHIQ